MVFTHAMEFCLTMRVQGEVKHLLPKITRGLSRVMLVRKVRPGNIDAKRDWVMQKIM